MIFRADYETLLDLNLAKEIGEILHTAYPGYLWTVRMPPGGGAIIRNLRISGKWCVFIKPSVMIDAASERKRKILQMAGEFLERASLARQRATGEAPAVFDVPKTKGGAWAPWMPMSAR